MFRQISTFRTLGHDSGEYLEIRLTKHLRMESIKYFCDSEKKMCKQGGYLGHLSYNIISSCHSPETFQQRVDVIKQLLTLQ